MESKKESELKPSWSKIRELNIINMQHTQRRIIVSYLLEFIYLYLEQYFH